MIIVTGAAGFIGSCLVGALNQLNYKDIVIVDDFSRIDKEPNWKEKTYSHKVERTDLGAFIDQNQKHIQSIIHLGARTDTTEFDETIFNRLNLLYTKHLWQKAIDYSIPFIYASSAATYGDGNLGYDDADEVSEQLQPLNPYGWSKQNFDLWALKQEKKPFFWAGLKFFNVYGPNEYHKGRMASVILHAFKQIKENGTLKLFKSHRDDYEHGQQMRDFVYVKDVVSVLIYLMENRPKSGIYNLGTGKARSFYDLGKATFEALGLEPNISFIDMPKDLRNTYQYFTEAKMDKLQSIGYTKPFRDLESGVKDYVQNYLVDGTLM